MPEPLVITVEAFNKATGVLEKVKQTLIEIDNAGRKVTTTYNLTNKGMQQISSTVADLPPFFERMKGKVMGAGFAMLFMGMSLRRFFEGMTKSVFTAYQTIMGETSKFGAQVGNLQAAFAFLKFSIFDALANTEFFATLVDWIVQLVNGISEFVSKHPALGRFILYFGIFGIILSGVAIILGNLTLAMTSFGLSALGATGVFFLLIAVLALLTTIWTSDLPTWAKGLLSIVTIVGGLILGSLMMGKAWNFALLGIGKAITWLVFSPVGMWLTAIAMLIVGVWWMSEAWGGFGNFFKAVIGGLIISLGYVAEWIMKGMLMPLKLAYDVVSALADAYVALAKAMGLPYKSVEKAGKYLDYFEAKADEWLSLGETATRFVMTNDWFKSAQEQGQTLTEGATGAMGTFNVAKNTLMGPLSNAGVAGPEYTTPDLTTVMPPEYTAAMTSVNDSVNAINNLSGGSNLAE